MTATTHSTWKDVFYKRGWISADGHIQHPQNARQATIQLGTMEYKLSDVSNFDEDTIEFTKGSLVDTYLWCQITRVTVFKS
jgi:hypothetical protein